VNVNRLIRLSGTAAITSGITLILLGLSFITQVFIGDVALTASFVLAILSQFFQVLAIFGFFTIQPRPYDKLAVTGFILMIAGITLNIIPLSDRILFLLGLLLFAVANQRAKALPKWGFWIWVIGAALALVFSMIGFNFFFGFSILIISAALIWLGTNIRKITP